MSKRTCIHSVRAYINRWLMGNILIKNSITFNVLQTVQYNYLLIRGEQWQNPNVGGNCCYVRLCKHTDLAVDARVSGCACAGVAGWMRQTGGAVETWVAVTGEVH